MLVWYIPVMNADRAAEQTGAVTNAFVKRAPSPANLSRFGVLAVSNSVLPVSGLGSPPKPSITKKTIFVGEGLEIDFINSKLIIRAKSYLLTFRTKNKDIAGNFLC